MTRQEKYPETNTFHYYNANPKNRLTTDCVIRAISRVTEKPYNQVVMDLAKIQCDTGYDPGDRGAELLLKQYGYTKMKQLRKFDNTMYSGKEFCKYLSDDLYIDDVLISRAVINIGGHHMSCIVDGKINDVWDCSNGRVGNWWVKLK